MNLPFSVAPQSSTSSRLHDTVRRSREPTSLNLNEPIRRKKQHQAHEYPKKCEQVRVYKGETWFETHICPLVIDQTFDLEAAAAGGFAVKTWHKICTIQAAKLRSIFCCRFDMKNWLCIKIAASPTAQVMKNDDDRSK